MDASGLLYVTDTTNHCIQVFNTENGAAASAWVFEGTFASSAQLSGDTRNLTIDRADNMVYVADAGNDVVDVFSTWNGEKAAFSRGRLERRGLIRVAPAAHAVSPSASPERKLRARCGSRITRTGASTRMHHSIQCHPARSPVGSLHHSLPGGLVPLCGSPGERGPTGVA